MDFETGTISLVDALFRPRTIALIGASDAPDKVPGRPLAFLKRDGFTGAIYPVNPNRDMVQGETAYKSLQDLPRRPDHAYVLVNTQRVVEAVRACGECGVPVVSILADGFAEAGEEGRRRQDQLLDVASAHGVRLLGPNSMGVADLHNGLSLTVNAVFAEEERIPGGFALLSQSGSMMGGLMTRAMGLGLGFSKLVALGNEADLTAGEVGDLLVDDAETDGFLLFLETIREAEKLAAFAARAHAAGKPVIAYKLGRSRVGQELAVSHTGALLADDAVVDAFLRDAGIARVATLEGLFEAATLFAGGTPPSARSGRPPRVGVLTTTGGSGAAVCDQLSVSGIELAMPSEATVAEIARTGIDVKPGVMIDLTLAGARYETVRSAVEAMARAPECDMVVIVLGSSSRSRPETAVQPLIDCDRNGKPVAAFLTPEATDGLRRLVSAGIPAFRTPETCADAIRAYCNWRAPRAVALQRKGPAATAGRVLDEASSLAWFGRLGVPCVSHMEVEIAELSDAALPFGFPVVAKVLSAEIAHKTDSGGVALGLADRDALIEAAGRIRQSVEAARPDARVTRILVEPMMDGLQEVLLGFRHDPQVGPVVTVAPGGVLVELYDDKAVRLAPVDVDTAREMVDEVVGLAPIRGYRNRPKGDLDALASAIAAFSNLAYATDSPVLEAEINPLLVRREGVVAVDALVRVVA